MYQRSYYPNEEAALCPPREYDGNLNFEGEKHPSDAVECKAEVKCDKRPWPLSLFRDFPSEFLNGFEIGIEEILIIGAALFLLISKSGDFECIFILIALLFVR